MAEKNKQQETGHPKDEQKHKYYKLHKNNVEFGTEMKPEESPESKRIKEEKIRKDASYT